ncbi:MAG: hypothetical protein RR933_09145 [Oscillospiraceae bacterium]
MADYKKMYTRLFNEVTDIVERLQRAQQITEDMYIAAKQEELVVFEGGGMKNISVKSEKGVDKSDI